MAETPQAWRNVFAMTADTDDVRICRLTVIRGGRDRLEEEFVAAIFRGLPGDDLARRLAPRRPMLVLIAASDRAALATRESPQVSA